jgi:hypothetical protein
MKIPVRTAALANLNHWRANQGAKIKAHRPIEVYRACEHMAQLAAAIRDPLTLTAEEIAIAIKRAISHERNKRHGPLGRITADEWWSQITAIAEQWGIKTDRSEWETKTTSDRKEAA